MHFFQSAQIIIQNLGLFGVFLVMLVENIGIPFPTEVGFLVAQGLITSGYTSYSFAVVIITSGHVAGSIISYGIGRFGNRKTTSHFEHNPRLKETKRKLTDWYRKYGSATIFFTRVFGYVRPWASLVAGFADVPFWPFLIWTTLGSLMFSSFSLYVTKYFVFVWQEFPEYHLLIALLVFVLFFGLIGYELAKGAYGKIRSRQK